jgi:hypothetical protein
VENTYKETLDKLSKKMDKLYIGRQIQRGRASYWQNDIGEAI